MRLHSTGTVYPDVWKKLALGNLGMSAAISESSRGDAGYKRSEHTVVPQGFRKSMANRRSLGNIE